MFKQLLSLRSFKNVGVSSFPTKRRYSSTKAEKTVWLWSGNIVFGEGGLSSGSVGIRNGSIVACHPGQSWKDVSSSCQPGDEAIDLGESNVLSPGLIDVHTHISALGRNWEGYTSATKAAAAGGITTIFGMPLNSIPSTTSADAVRQEREAASASELYVDVGLWGGVVPGNAESQAFQDLLDSEYIFGFKAFLAPLPPNAGYEAVSPDILIAASKRCGKAQKPLLVHSELMTQEEVNEWTERAFANRKSDSYVAHVESRPALWEKRAIEVVCEASKNCHAHIVHLSDAIESIGAIKNAKERGRLSVETCPHYLLLDESRIADGETRLKCFPPIRDPENRKKLLEALLDGTVDMVASDHSPCESKLRIPGDFRTAWGGLTGLQYQLQATWTAVSSEEYNCSPVDMATWWSRNPARLANVSDYKGSIEVGKQADLVWWDPAFQGAPSSVAQEYHRWKGDCHYSDNSEMRGRVLGTWVKGNMVYDGLLDEHKTPAGKLLTLNS